MCSASAPFRLMVAAAALLLALFAGTARAETLVPINQPADPLLPLMLPTPVAVESIDLSPLPWYLRAVERRTAGDLEGAIEALERARQIAPLDPDLALELGRTYAAARWYGLAAVAFDDAVRLAPGRADLVMAQASFHLDHAFRVGRALAAAERAATLRPDDPAAIRLLDRARSAAALADRSE